MGKDQVTLRDVLEVTNRIEDKLDKRVQSIEEDVERLKANQNRALGAFGILSGVVTLATNYIWNKVTGSNQ